jgi:hypothetical protein
MDPFEVDSFPKISTETTDAAGYRAMAMDRERELAAEEWSEALIGDSYDL